MNLKKINPLFQQLETDYLYHLGIDSSMPLESLFSDIKYVIFSRYNDDTSLFVHEFAKQWYQIKEEDFEFKPLFKTERYHLHKVGPILAISYGVGAQSMSICLNEIVKLLVHAKVPDSVTFLKIGPAGGIGISPGEIIISNAALNHKLEQSISIIACGEEHNYSTHLDQNIINELTTYLPIYQKINPISVQTGAVLNASDYYESQARLNGFLSLPYSTEAQDAYLKKLKNLGVKSIDMESLYFAGFCNQLDIKTGIVNLIIVNRLLGDDILINKMQQFEFLRHTFQFVIHYIIHKLKGTL